MKAERWRQVETLYHAALEREPDARDAFLAQACAGDEELRRDVEELLSYDGAAESFIQGDALAFEAKRLEPDELSQTGPQLLPGQSVGAYKILALLGRGGMGVVYRARDERLRRDVAIKVLPASFANDADRLRRFEQEAHATSALNHPNILTIYDIGTQDGAPFIVAELLEGEELRAQLEHGAIPARRALDYAQQIATGLAVAHEKGIVHRDLKPENLFVTKDGRVKILDFGLAKLKPQAGEPVNSQVATQKNLTDPGTVMGTVGYMAPEQVRGQKADTRADLFSFGVILYEMLGGRRPFSGASAIEVMNSILKDEAPELGETNPKISPQLDKLVRRCLEKQPERRFQTAYDLGFALEALSTNSSSRLESPAVETSSATPLRSGREKWWMGATALLLLAMLGLTWAYFTRQPATNAQVMRMMKFSILPPEKSSFEQIAVSPDGRHLAFTAATGGKVQLWVRALDSTEARALDGTQGATLPFWSPDNRFIAFFADGRLKKIEVTGGLALTLCEVPGPPFGGAWSRDGGILFGRSGATGLLRVSATGGEVTQVTNLDRARQELTHRNPTFLPDGKHFLYTIPSGQKETRGVYLSSLDGSLKRRLLDEVTVIRYMAALPGDASSGSGWLVFVADRALLARPFDARRFEFTGEPFSLSDKVGSFLSTNYFTFSVSDNGVLVFDRSGKLPRRQYRWVDRRGQQIKSLDVDGGSLQHWLSPDEKRFVADKPDPKTGTFDLWLYDVSGGNPQKLTFDPATDFNPVWSPDGSRIVWASNRNRGILNLYQRASSIAGDDTLLRQSDYLSFPTDWSWDGRFIIFHQLDPKTNWDVWVLPVTGSGEAFPVVPTKANEIEGSLSPDGRWLAYASDESGRYEVYVQSFPGGSGKRPVSTGGGAHPRWRRDGRELFYYAGDGKLMAAPVPRGEIFETDVPVALFEFRAGTTQGFAPYAVTGDGQRFLINVVEEREPNAPLTVWINWAASIKK